jgi:hypothetical protein
MKRIVLGSCVLVLVLLLGAIAPAAAKEAVATKPMTLRFGGVDYVHRWSQKGQNEFTPPAQPDLARWQDMVTINLHEEVGNGDQLAAMANAVLGGYQRNGKIVRTDSKPLTPQRPAEHLAVAILAAPGLVEAVFARFVLVGGRGMVVVYSHRAYGTNAAATIGGWLQAKGPSVEATLMAWQGMPQPAQLRALPQAKGK